MAAFLMDKISRRWTLLLGALVSIVGAVIQTAANGSIMMIFGRALSGLSSGLVYPTAPVYLAELSAPENRGFLVGLKGLMNTLGFFTAGFVGYAGSFAVGNLQWRIPLATQAPPAVLLAVLTIFLPYSPRWRTFTPHELPPNFANISAHSCPEGALRRGQESHVLPPQRARRGVRRKRILRDVRSDPIRGRRQEDGQLLGPLLETVHSTHPSCLLDRSDDE